MSNVLSQQVDAVSMHIQGVGAVGGHKEGLVPRAVALLHHLGQTSQHKGTLTVTQSGKHARPLSQSLLNSA